MSLSPKNRFVIWISIVLGMQFADVYPFVCVHSNYDKLDLVYSDKMSSMVFIPQGWTIENSESVFVDGRLLERGSQYEFDARNGVIIFKQQIAETSSVVIKFARSPYLFKPEYTLRNVSQTWGQRADVDSKRNLSISDSHPKEDSRFQGIRASGTKSIRIETSSVSGFRISQALDLKINGSAGEAQVTGHLSDRDMVTGRLGASSRLRDLDRIFVEVASKNASVRIGDIEIREKRGELFSITREATGIHGRIGSDSKGLVVSGSARRNVEKTALIEAKEGLSGPYVIPVSDQGYRGIVVNSEKVYLDGRGLKRGEANDYTIDYDRGLIFFNPRVVLREGSRIVVTYEIESDNAEEIYYIGSDLALGGMAKISATYAARTTSGEALLSQIDSTASLIWADGGTYIGQGLGDYVKITSDSVVYYKYVGVGQGDYQVKFTKIGEGKGKYIEIRDGNSNRTVYLYTGSGPFIDKIPMIPPTRQNLLHLSGELSSSDRVRLLCEVGKAQGEGGEPNESTKASYLVSLDTKNTLPGIGEKNLGEIGLSVRRLVTQPIYSHFKERQNAEFLEKWKRDLTTERASQELRCTYRLPDVVSFSASTGELESTSGKSRRQDLDGSINILGTRLSLGLDRVHLGSDGQEASYHSDYQSLDVPFTSYKFSLGRKDETRRRGDDSLSLRRTEYRADFQRSKENLKTIFSLVRIAERRLNSFRWVPYCEISSAELTLSANPSRKLDLRSGLIYKLSEYEQWTMQGKNSLLTGDFHLNLRDLGILSEGEIGYSLTRRLSSRFESELVRTTGVGDYDSLGNYLPGVGGFCLSYKEVGKQPVAHAALAGNFVLGQKGKLLPKRNLVARSSFEIEAEIDASEFAEAALIYGAFGKNAAYSSSDFRQDLTYRGTNGFSLRLDGSFSRLNDGRCIDRSQIRNRIELGGQVRYPSSKSTTIVFELRNQTLSRRMTSSDLNSSSNQRTVTANFGVEFNPSSVFQTSINTELCRSEMDSPAMESITARVRPTMAVQSHGIRFTSSLSIRRVIESDGKAVPSFGRNSFELNSRADIRRSQAFWISLEYNLVKMSGIQAIQTMRSSFNASF